MDGRRRRWSSLCWSGSDRVVGRWTCLGIWESGEARQWSGGADDLIICSVRIRLSREESVLDGPIPAMRELATVFFCTRKGSVGP